MPTAIEIEAKAVEELRQLISPEGVREIIDIYLDDAPKRLADFQSGLRGGDLALARRAVHSLKSTASYLGARSFSTFCAELETAARLSDTAALADGLPQLENRLTQVLAELGQVRDAAAP
jgi:HPt (histidine-containing phosphotransfer) domain-containing protein